MKSCQNVLQNSFWWLTSPVFVPSARDPYENGLLKLRVVANQGKAAIVLQMDELAAWLAMNGHTLWAFFFSYRESHSGWRSFQQRERNSGQWKWEYKSNQLVIVLYVPFVFATKWNMLIFYPAEWSGLCVIPELKAEMLLPSSFKRIQGCHRVWIIN